MSERVIAPASTILPADRTITVSVPLRVTVNMGAYKRAYGAPLYMADVRWEVREDVLDALARCLGDIGMGDNIIQSVECPL